jgi:rhamnogalacturonyl hydrolase YesR
MIQYKEKHDRRFYILVGDKENWETSVKNKIWGFTEVSKGSWNTIEIDEIVAFYVTTPIKKIIGFGKVADKFIDEALIWNDEKRFKRSLWKYKINLEIIHLCQIWDDGISLGPEFFLNTPRKVINKQLFLELVNRADQKWGTEIRNMIQ